MSKHNEIFGSDSLHEECGVFGIYDMGDNLDVARLTYYGLYALQHRGQESCGIAVTILTRTEKSKFCNIRIWDWFRKYSIVLC